MNLLLLCPNSSILLCTGPQKWDRSGWLPVKFARRKGWANRCPILGYRLVCSFALRKQWRIWKPFARNYLSCLKNQLKWNGCKKDLLRFLALHVEVQPNQIRANDNGTCAVFKIQNITCNFYHKAKTLQIQGKEDADKLRKDLINLTSAWAHPVSETLNAFQENLDNDV